MSRHLHASAGQAAPADGTVPAPAIPDTTQADRLRNPADVGRLRDTLTALDNDPVIVALERRMRCTCGCTLDIYTCRTTDFTCTFSPALHQEVVALHSAGRTPAEILAHFVAREGEAILMAPPAEGFDLVGYVVPGLAMATGVLALVAWIGRRKAAVAVAEAHAPSTTVPTPPDDAARDRLRDALSHVDD